MLDQFVARSLKAQDAKIQHGGSNIRTLLDGTRGINSNGWLLVVGCWLLGDLREPMHLLGMAGDIDMRTIDVFYLMRDVSMSKVDERRLAVV